MSASGSRTVRWTWSLLGVLLALLGAEALARVRLAERRARVYRADAARIYAPIPGSHKRFLRPRPGAEPLPIVLRFDEHGYRAPDGPSGPPAGADAAGGGTVVVYGDSFVEARYVPFEETFCQRLAAHLATELGQRPAVLNAGLSGYGPDQSLLRMRAELPVLRPDLVVFAVFAGNDFGDLVRNKLFVLEGERLVERAPRLAPEVAEFLAPPPALALLQAWSERRPVDVGPDPVAAGPGAPGGTQAGIGPERLERILDLALSSCAEEYAELERGDRLVRHPFRDRYDADLSLLPTSASARYKARLMREVLARVAATAREAGVPLLFLFVPHLLDTCPPLASVDTGRWPEYAPTSKTDLLTAAADALGVPCLDLAPPFRSSCERGLYFTVVDDHWNPTGQDLAAELCARTIAERALLP